MKTGQIKLTAAFALFITLNTAFAQGNRSERDYDNNRNDRNDYNDRDYRNGYDRDDNERISDYERGRNDYRRNPYDYRNLPRDWDRRSSSRFDWYRFDWDNRYDPRYNDRDLFDLYYPWDPNNPYDIRNRRDYYSNNQYWNGGRPNRIVIVPPAFRFGRPSWAYGNGNRGRSHHGRSGRW